MRWRPWTIAWIMLILAGWARPALGQFNFSTVSPLGYNRQQEEPEEIPLDTDSCVAFLDSAVPHTSVRTRLDLAYRYRQPNRAEYFWAKGGLAGPGPLFPETRVDYQDWRNYGEFALNPWFSLFLETPFRWVNPEVNPNTAATGDINFGLKFAFISNETWVTTVQMRAYWPTGGSRGVGNEHVTLEPGLLVNYRLAQQLILEGELKYWMPMGGTDFAGDIVQYGIGLTWGNRTLGEMWVAPVVELIGYTILGGKSTVAYGPFSAATVDADGTIVNAALGVRMGWSKHADWYVGYNRSMSGAYWHKDLVRIEFRYQF